MGQLNIGKSPFLGLPHQSIRRIFSVALDFLLQFDDLFDLK